MLKTFRNKAPKVANSAYIQEGVKIEGDVVLGELVSVWYNATIRGDINAITIGEGSNIQELSTIHVDHDFPTHIGKYVTIGHNVVLHGCTIGDNSLIGMGSIVLNGAEIGDNCLVGAGSVVGQNQIFPPNSLIIGNPAKFKRTLKEEELNYIKENTQNYVELAKEHLEEENAKTSV